MTATRPMRRPPAWLSPESFPFRSRWLEVGDSSLHYVDEGDGPTVMFIAGSPMWSFMMRAAISGLRDRYRCIAVDLPGLGLSSGPVRKGFAHRDATALLGQFVQSLDLRGAVLAVHATAGPAGLQVAIRQSERFAGLVISNSFAWPLDGDPRLRFFVRLVSSRLFAFLNLRLNFLPRVAARFGRRNGSFTAAERAAILGPFAQRQTRRHLQNLLYGVRAEREQFVAVERDLARLAHLPTLLLYGAHDNGAKAGFVDRWREHLPNHRVAILPHAGHFPFEDEPELAVAELRAWLDELTRGAGENRTYAAGDGRNTNRSSGPR